MRHADARHRRCSQIKPGSKARHDQKTCLAKTLAAQKSAATTPQTNVSRETFRARGRRKNLANTSATHRPRSNRAQRPRRDSQKKRQREHKGLTAIRTQAYPAERKGAIAHSRAAAGAGRSAAGQPWQCGRPQQGGRGDGALCGQREGRRQIGLSRRSVCRRRPLRGVNNAGRRGNPTPSLLVLLIPQMGPTSPRPPSAWRAPLGGCCTAAPSRGPPGRKPPARTGSGPWCACPRRRQRR